MSLLVFVLKHEWFLGSCTARKSQPSTGDSSSTIEESLSQSIIHVLYTPATQDLVQPRQWGRETRISREGLWLSPFLLWGNCQQSYSYLSPRSQLYCSAYFIVKILYPSPLCFMLAVNIPPPEEIIPQWMQMHIIMGSILTVTKWSMHLLFMLAIAFVGIYAPPL